MLFSLVVSLGDRNSAVPGGEFRHGGERVSGSCMRRRERVVRIVKLFHSRCAFKR